MTTWYVSTQATAGNLQDLINYAASGDTIKITPYASNGGFVANSVTMTVSTYYDWLAYLGQNNFTYAYGTPIVINKNLTIDGDWNDDGIPDLTLTATGGGPALAIKSGVTVTLEGVKFANSNVSTLNGANAGNYGLSGADAPAAVSAIYNAGTLTLNDVDFVNNTATAGRGGYGGNGWYISSPAAAGASGDDIEGTYGANGSNGVNSSSPGGAGGRGGDAATVYNLGSITTKDVTFVGNTATAGNGAAGGAGGNGQSGGRGGDGENGSFGHDGGNGGRGGNGGNGAPGGNGGAGGNGSAQFLGGYVLETGSYTASANTATAGFGAAGGYGGSGGAGGQGGYGGARGSYGASSGADGDWGTSGYGGANGSPGTDGYSVNSGGNNTVGLYVDSNTQYESSANATKTITFWVTRSGELNVAQNVTLNFSYGAGLNAADFSGTAPTTQTVYFAAGEQQKAFTYTLVNDGVTEGAETLTASLLSPSNGLQFNSSPQQVVTINDTFTYHGVEINNPYQQPIIQFSLPSPATSGANAVLLSSTAPGGTSIYVSAAGGIAQIQLTQYYHGTFEFTYRLYNSSPTYLGYTGVDYNDYTVVVDIEHRNVVPTSTYYPRTVGTQEDTPYSGYVKALDVETPADQMVYTVYQNVQHGTLTLNTNGTYTYTPNADYNGSDSFYFRASDTEGGSYVDSVSISIAAVNDPPVAATAAESAYGYRDQPITGTLLAGSDIDSAALSYHVVANSAQHGTVTIDPDTRAFVFTPEADYYGAASFQYVLNDGALDSTAKTVTIYVNAPAVISGAVAGNVTEAGGTANAAPGTPTATGTLHAADVDDTPDTFVAVATATASQNGYGTFTMTADGTWTYVLDNANPTVDELKADATLTDTFTVYSIDGTPQVVTITITGANDMPVAHDASARGDEDTAIHGTVTADDVDRPSDTLTFLLVGQNGGAQHGTVTIDATTGAFVYTPAQDYYGTDSFSVVVNDGTADSSVATVTVTIDPVNDPAVITTTTPIDVAENTTIVAALTSTDVDGPQAGTFTITGGVDAALFNIVGGHLVFRAAHDYETEAHSYQVEVTAFDGLDNTPKMLIVNLTDGNDNAPVFANGASATASTAENTAASTVIYTAAATDADGTTANNTIVYSLSGDDAALFSIDATGAIRFLSAPDYEAPADLDHDHRYQVTVHANDGVHDVMQDVAISVTDTNDNAPVFAPQPSASVAESTATSVIVYTAHASDADISAAFNTITYSLSGDDASLFAIDPVTGAIRFLASPDYEVPADHDGDNFYRLTVHADDGVHDVTDAVTIAVTDLNDNAPVFAAGATATMSVIENTLATMVVHTASAVDADGTAANNTIVYSLAGDDAGLFSVDAATGAIRFRAAPDYEAPADHDYDNRYQFTVHANDGVHDVTQDVTIAVTDTNDNAPIFAAHAASPSASIAENTAASVAVFTSRTSDADVSLSFRTITYSLSGDDAARFAIDPVTGAVHFVAAPDYEAPTDHAGDNLYRFTVHANDGVHDVTDDVTVAVTEVNDNAPVFISGPTASEAENTPASAVVYAARATDADGAAASNTISYSLSGDDAGLFSIDAASGDVRFLKKPLYAAPLDADHDNVYRVTVHANDGVHDVTQNVEIGVIDVAPRPIEVAAAVPFGLKESDWRTAGLGDFNGDGVSDVLWRNTQTGQVDEWQMRDGNWSASIDLGGHGAGWQIAGIGDFNADGTDDILWRDTATGRLDAWIMSDGRWSRSADLGSHGADWAVIGVGDFDGDGTDDLLFQNRTTGAVDEWQMHDGNWARSVSLGTHNAAWSSVVIGDFNGDGTDDVLWRNPTTGQVDEWQMRDGNWLRSLDLGSYDPGYRPAAVYDVDGDGTTDVLWHNAATGRIDAWLMNEGRWFGSTSLGTLDPARMLADLGDFGDGGVDLLWRDTATGQTGTWLLHGV